MLFDGTNLNQWVGDTSGYRLEGGNIVVHPEGHGAGNLYTKDEYSDFIYRFEFKLTPGANNGIGIRAPLEGDAAYDGMEIQVLDNDADIYKNLQVYQYHGSVYGVIPAKRGFLKPLGEWNEEEIAIQGNKIKVTQAVVLAFTLLFIGNPKFYLDVADDPAFLPGYVVLLVLYVIGFVSIRKMIDLKV